jgi:sortase A
MSARTRARPHRMATRLRGVVGLGALAASLPFAVAAAWIPVKAEVAQVLLQRAWSRARQGAGEARPWPWADTWPVGRLRAPSLGVDEIILAGASGSSLAFGPGHVDGTALPGHCGNCVLSGHRDTHFRFLRRLRLGDALELEAPDGTVQHFVVRATHVLDRSDVFVLEDSDHPLLTLITCYPFDAVVPGGPQRFVVWAEPAEA